MNDLQQCIMDALRAQEAVTRDHINMWVKGYFPEATNQEIGGALRGLRDKGHIVQNDDESWSVVRRSGKPMTYGSDGEKRNLAPFHAKAKPVTVTVSYGEEEIDDVLDLTYFKGQDANPVILNGNYRIMISANTPLWHPSQRSIENVTRVEITKRGGEVTKINVPRTHILTIAPQGD